MCNLAQRLLFVNSVTQIKKVHFALRLTLCKRNANMPVMKLADYIESSPRGTLRAIAKAIGAHEPDVSRWASGERPVPLHHAAAIESATAGAVTRQDLRPRDWRAIWPELAEKV